MSDNFKDVLNKHFDRQKLSEHQLLRLKESQKDSFWFQVSWKTASLATILLVLAVSFYFVKSSLKPIQEKIASEVIYNHIKNKPPEVLTSSFIEAGQALNKLPFKILANFRGANEYLLQGARYCSVQSKIAAQIKLVNKKNKKILTLYQYQLDDSDVLFRGEFELENKNVKVQLWQEGNIGFALVEPISLF